ncbi:hypothetical protein PUN28_007735 [Cardiocondyla obscurior]|uniref:Uncharacterized protein n=1 Tax=Cardiocondyla obscurior TaxID=286306 RepID=A0AAW2FVY5_9HYME
MELVVRIDGIDKDKGTLQSMLSLSNFEVCSPLITSEITLQPFPFASQSQDRNAVPAPGSYGGPGVFRNHFNSRRCPPCC